MWRYPPQLFVRLVRTRSRIISRAWKYTCLLQGGACSWEGGGLLTGGACSGEFCCQGGACSKGVCVETPRDGYCCGRYTSYWNACLLLVSNVKSYWWSLLILTNLTNLSSLQGKRTQMCGKFALGWTPCLGEGEWKQLETNVFIEFS